MSFFLGLGWLVAAAAGGVVWTLRERLRVAQAEHDALLARTRVVLGEAEASVRRIRDERERARPFDAEPVLRDLLEIVDNLDRAIAAGEGGSGVLMIQRQSLEMLRRHGAERIVCLAQPFDPTAHEAVATSPAVGEPHRVLHELSAGYRLHGRLLRPARVVVAVPTDDTPAEEVPAPAAPAPEAPAAEAPAAEAPAAAAPAASPLPEGSADAPPLPPPPPDPQA